MHIELSKSKDTKQSIVQKYKHETIGLFNQSQDLLAQSKVAQDTASTKYYFEALTAKQKKSLFEQQEQSI